MKPNEGIFISIQSNIFVVLNPMKILQRYIGLFSDILKHLGSYLVSKPFHRYRRRSLNRGLLCVGVVGICLLSQITLASPSAFQASSENWGNHVNAMEKKWEKDYENYFGQDLGKVTLTASDIANTLSQISRETKMKPAVIWVVPDPEGLTSMLITPGQEAIGQVNSQVKPEQLSQSVTKLFEEINKVRNSENPSYLEPAQQLYQWIIKPFEDNLKAEKIDSLLFCLGQGLRTLPLAVLHDGKQFLIENYSLTLIPAFNLIKLDYAKLQNSQVLAMGASEFRQQSPLPAVPLELSTIVPPQKPSSSAQAENSGQWLGRTFLNQNFTIDNLKRQLASRSFEIVHLATHAEFKPGKPGNSYIQFWENKLELDQIRQLNWNDPQVELLVLSACKTAVGDADVELGFAGLAFQSGVKSALASLWYVSDTGTLALMSEFYQQLKTIPTKAEALRQTQLGMIHGDVRLQPGELLLSRGEIPLPPEIANSGADNLSHPYYWAAFSLIGSPW